MRRCMWPSTRSDMGQKCRIGCRKRFSSPKNRADKATPVPKNRRAFPPEIVGGWSAYVQLRDIHFAFDQLGLAPLALLVQGHPAALLAAVMPILVKLVINQ